MRGTAYENMHFCDVLFSSGKKQIRENTFLKQHAFLVDSLGVWPRSGSPFCAASRIHQVIIVIQKGSPKGAHSEFWRAQRIRASQMYFWCLSTQKIVCG